MTRLLRVLTVGETMGLAVNDRPGTLAASRAHTLSFGGAESNVAIALARLGASVSWVSRLGADPLGDLIIRELLAEGIAVQAPRDPRRPTGFMHRHRRTDSIAEVSFWRDGSAAASLSPADVPDALLQQTDLVHLTGILPGLSSTTRECALDTARRARAWGAAVSFDINHRAGVWRNHDPRATYAELTALADIVFAGAEEAALLVGEGTPRELAQRLRDLGPRKIVIKLGAHGAVGIDGDEICEHPVYPVAAIDTVGAGDAFVAGYLSLWKDEVSLHRRLERATTAGAFACTVVGDWEGAPTIAEISRLGDPEGIAR